MSRTKVGKWRIVAAAATMLTLVAAMALSTSSAGADTAPAVGTPATVSADSLPTMQINGIVWAQVVVGNTVYATGNFTKARPAGAALGTNETPVGNIVAYDITTGKMITTFIHSLNAQGRSLAASPDGSTVYVGGDFTTVDGVAHSHIAAFDAKTGALLTRFTASVSNSVTALAATNSAVYVGGSFGNAGGKTRTNLAAFTSAGALTAWAPAATGGYVMAMVLTPDRGRVIVGGHFSALSGVTAYGMGSINAVSGAIMPWAANQTIMDYGPGAAIDTLSVSAGAIYGGGYTFNGATENFEGRFAANPNTGALIWLNDCQGDTYGTWPMGSALYSVGHSHDCQMVGSFPNLFPANEQWHRAVAESVTATSTNTGPDMYGWNYNGQPAAAVLDWFPSMSAAPPTVSAAPAGTVAVSGAAEAGWSVTGNAAGTYLAIGGETLKVNGVAQQGLARFAIKSLAPHAVGPEFNSVLKPAVTAGATAGTATITLTAAWDRDNQNLTYQVRRDGAALPVYTTSMASTFWQLPTATFTDSGLTAGTHTYQVSVIDPDGNAVKASNSVTITNGSPAPVVITPAAPAAGATAADATKNLALNTPDTVSTVYQPPTQNPAQQANDGNPATMGLASSGPQAWWQTDLGASKPVTKISVLGRSTCCTSQSADVYVFASNTPFNTALTPTQQAQQAGVWSGHQAGSTSPAVTWTLPANTTARYILVQHGGTDYLALNEVTVN